MSASDRIAATHRKRKRDALWVEAAAGLAIGIAVAMLSLRLGLLQELELLTLDYRFAQREAARAEDPERRDVYTDGDVVIVEIADEDLQALPERFPFPRSYYAHLVENLRAAGARAVVFDLTFGAEGQDDDAFRDVLREQDDVVLGAKVRGGDALGRYDLVRLEEDYDNVFFAVNPALGIVNVLRDRDGVVRRYAPMMTVSDRLTPTLAMAALGRAAGLPPLTAPAIEADHFRLGPWAIPRYDPRTFLLDYYGPVGTFRYIPFSHVIDDARFETADEQAYGVALDLFDEATQGLVRDRIVLVGSTMAEERDYHSVPLANPNDPDRSRAMHGVEIHATAIQNVLDGRHLRGVSAVWETALVVLLALVTFVGTRRLRRSKTVRTRFLEAALLGGVVLMVLGWLWGATALFVAAGRVVSVVPPVLSVALAYTGAAVYSYLAEREQKAFIKETFGQYLSPAVVEELAEHPEKVQLGGEEREMTTLFSDIAGFTSISEALTPNELVALLNDYLDEMTRVIFEHGGTLDKYIGDAIMAFWNAPLDQPDHALRACRAALGMRHRLDALRPIWEQMGRPSVHARIGVATGRMVVGNFGSVERFDYTVMGDTVNLASRLEGANKLYGTTVMISADTYEAVREHVVVRELDVIRVKGRREPIAIYELLGLAEGDGALPEAVRAGLGPYTAGLAHYRARSWEEALQLMEEACAKDPDCAPARVYIDRLRHYRDAPPPEDWDGVFTMTTK